jgi:hypothetical protein
MHDSIDIPVAADPSETDIFNFDLNGFLILREALKPDDVAACNAVLDELMGLNPPLTPGEWFGAVHAHTYSGTEGVNLQQIYEAGAPFERLIDHPAWIEKVKHFVGGQNTFDTKHGPLFIDENFASIRGPGEAIGIHSGGQNRTKRTQFRQFNGKFFCGQVNILLALTDIGPGDGGTMVIPGSHKANFMHPGQAAFGMGRDEQPTPGADGMPGALEVHLKAGDALLFVDALMHGSATRVNEEGQRRITVYRYGASWGNFRHPYYPSDELLERLTPARRKTVLPQEPIKRQPNRIADYPDPPHAVSSDRYTGG